jgi:hypothetical protein
MRLPNITGIYNTVQEYDMRLTTKLKMRIKDLEQALELQELINDQQRDDRFGRKSLPERGKRRLRTS